MGTCHRTAHRRFLLFAVAALLLSSSVFAAPAARVEFTLGNVSAVAADGRVRALVKGSEVVEGDTVNTNEGRVQLRFTDEGFVSLHTRTVFRIDQYRWGGVNDGSERSFFSLIEGGLRTITGKLAKHNRKAYRMTTTFATVGIRGTEYAMQLNGGLSGSVAAGEIEVCNAGGCLAVPAGQSYYVPDSNTKPILSNKQTYLPPTQPVRDAALVESTVGAATGTAGGLAGAAGGLLDATTSGGALTTLGTTATGLSNTLGTTSGPITTTVNASGGAGTPVTSTPGTLTNGIIGTNPLLGPIKLGF